MYNNKQEDKTHQKWELKKTKKLFKRRQEVKKRGEKKDFQGSLSCKSVWRQKIPSSSAPSLSPKSSVCFFVRGPRIKNGENGGKKTIQEYTRLRKKTANIKFPRTFQEKHFQGGKS